MGPRLGRGEQNGAGHRPRRAAFPLARSRAPFGAEFGDSYRGIMAKRCEICEKGPVVGRTVSHAHNVGPRRFEPNLQTVRALVNGATKRMRVCTRCLRSGKVTKAA
jgi:large subunit ribosomal protein L28